MTNRYSVKLLQTKKKKTSNKKNKPRLLCGQFMKERTEDAGLCRRAVQFTGDERNTRKQQAHQTCPLDE